MPFECCHNFIGQMEQLYFEIVAELASKFCKSKLNVCLEKSISVGFRLGGTELIEMLLNGFQWIKSYNRKILCLICLYELKSTENLA